MKEQLDIFSLQYPITVLIVIIEVIIDSFSHILLSHRAFCLQDTSVLSISYFHGFVAHSSLYLLSTESLILATTHPYHNYRFLFITNSRSGQFAAFINQSQLSSNNLAQKLIQIKKSGEVRQCFCQLTLIFKRYKKKNISFVAQTNLQMVISQRIQVKSLLPLFQNIELFLYIFNISHLRFLHYFYNISLLTTKLFFFHFPQALIFVFILFNLAFLFQIQRTHFLYSHSSHGSLVTIYQIYIQIIEVHILRMHLMYGQQ